MSYELKTENIGREYDTDAALIQKPEFEWAKPIRLQAKS